MSNKVDKKFILLKWTIRRHVVSLTVSRTSEEVRLVGKKRSMPYRYTHKSSLVNYFEI